MGFLNKRAGCSLSVTDQINIHMPPEVFTNEATNFWIGVLFGGLVVAALLSALSQQ
jgi:hypothetical protein